MRGWRVLVKVEPEHHGCLSSLPTDARNRARLGSSTPRPVPVPSYCWRPARQSTVPRPPACRGRAMTKPVRRAFWILLIAGGAVALGLVLAQDQETLKPRSELAVEDARFPAYLAALVGADLTRGNRYEVLTNGDQIFPAMLKAIDEAQNAHQLRDLHLRHRHGGQAVHRRARAGGPARRARPADHRRRRRELDGEGARGSAAGGRLHDRGVQHAALVLARGSQLPHAPQDPRRRRRPSASPAAPASPTTGWATRRTRSTGATRRSG